jgi:hypothetical protein
MKPFGSVESSVRIGEYVETLILTSDKVVVSYSGPPMPQELQAELAKFWAARIDAIAWQVMTGGKFHGTGRQTA